MNKKEKKITIEAQLLIPLSELETYLWEKGDEFSNVSDLIYNKNSKMAEWKMERNVKKILVRKKLDIKIKEFNFSHNSSRNISHGTAYFNATLKGTEKSLRKITGETALFVFDWEKYKQVEKSKSNVTMSR